MESGAAAHSKTQARIGRGNCGNVLECGGGPPLLTLASQLVKLVHGKQNAFRLIQSLLSSDCD
jgi:hypothetical protein